MSIEKSLQRAFKRRKEKKYDKIFTAVDLHDVIFPGNYTLNNHGKEFYPGAKEVLQFFSARSDIVLILWTSSHKKPIQDVLKWLKENKINFDFVNENPLCLNTLLCQFDKKFYFDLLLDDKAGFSAESDWFKLKKELIRMKEWITLEGLEKRETQLG